jgi:DNA primase
MSDIDRMRRDISLAETAVSFGVKLQRNGNEWEACCPFHRENTPSFTVYTGRDGTERFQCFGCAAKGDVIDFVKAIKGVETSEAIMILGGGSAGPNVPTRIITEARDVYAGIELLVPRSGLAIGRKVRLYNPKRADDDRAWGEFSPSMVFPYYRSDLQPLGYVLRRDLGDGHKETPMVCWVRLPSGEECWSRFPFPRPRPLYRHERLIAGQVVLVEGEKCADAMVACTGRQSVSWPGGTNGVGYTDWSPLAGRSVVIWPDADTAGLGTAEAIATILHAMSCEIKLLDVRVAA